MSDSYAQFEKRISLVAEKHARLAGGYTARVGADGLISLVPRPRRSYMRLRVFAALIIGFFLFKSLTIVLTGPLAYAERVEVMAAGTAFEKVGAWVMQIGPVSEFISLMMIRLFS
ncbi:hypothetical protein [uncultured Roseobacter sp.]|uniref:hypothetical protein n=1 Tax=uncultured Roseobacter sp. TaxID=114847 RepID=UPI0026344A77|nr:hypothetical protein [uncultured Roseobacter sp.]